jgi:hypothetical protein
MRASALIRTRVRTRVDFHVYQRSRAGHWTNERVRFAAEIGICVRYYMAGLRMVMAPEVSATREPEGDGRRAEVDGVGSVCGALPLRTA